MQTEKYVFLLQTQQGKELILGSGSLDRGKELAEDLEQRFEAWESNGFSREIPVPADVEMLLGSEILAVPYGQDCLMLTGDQWEPV